MSDGFRFPKIIVNDKATGRIWDLGGAGVGKPVSRHAFLEMIAPWEAMQVWGPIVQSSTCPACHARILDHRHGFYAPSGGGE